MENRLQNTPDGFARLWAPWRSEYIQDTVRSTQDGCLFCALPQDNHDEENLILRRTEHVFVIMNKYPYNNGHVLIVPFLHVSKLVELPKEVHEALFHETTRMTTALESAFHPDGMNVGMNLGRAAGAGIEQHLHVHIVPRWIGDTNFMPIFTGAKVISQSLNEGWKLLQKTVQDM